MFYVSLIFRLMLYYCSLPAICPAWPIPNPTVSSSIHQRTPYDCAALCQAVTTSATVSEAVSVGERRDQRFVSVSSSDPEPRPLSP